MTRLAPALRRGSLPVVLCLLTALEPSALWGWDAKTHAQLADAALKAVSERDRLPQRLGDETWRLHYYVQMADWWDCFVSASDHWTIRSESYEPTVTAQFYGNDFLIFPGWPGGYHTPLGEPEYTTSAALRFHRPYFLRALQALRTESSPNAARWMGSLMHMVTDQSAPPHIWRMPGDPDMKDKRKREILGNMESWVDASHIDLSGYEPRLLGQTDEEAAQVLYKRASALIDFSRIRAPRMVPFSEANDCSHVESITLEIVTETARLTADAIHTLFSLARQVPEAQSASLVGEVTAPPIAGMDVLPAKLVLLGTNYSTLSEPLVEGTNVYRGSFSLRNIPPGDYRGIVERVGARPLSVGPLVLRAGQTVHVHWQLQPSDPPGNLFRNPDLQISWVAKGVPDHWLLGGLWRIAQEKGHWVSDNTPVHAGEHYRAGYKANGPGTPTVKLEWMEEHWKPLDTQLVVLPPTSTTPAGMELAAPPKAIYARCIVEGSKNPADSVHLIFLTQVH